MTLKKGYRIFILGAAASVVSVVLLLWYLFGHACSNRVIAVIPSPDSWYKAVVFSRECGATTTESTQVSVLWAWSQLEGAGNVFVAEAGGGKSSGASEVHVSWRSARDLVVTYGPSARVLRSETKVGDIAVHYPQSRMPAAGSGAAH